MPAFANCILTSISTASGLRENSYFVPSGENFERNKLPRLYLSDDVMIEVVFFTCQMNGVPLFDLMGVEIFEFSEVRTIGNACRIISRETECTADYCRDICSSAVSIFVFSVFRELETRQPACLEHILNLVNNDRLYQLLSYVHAHLNEELNIEDLSRMVNLSADYISQFFKRHMGVPLQQYMANARIRTSICDLVIRPETISHISERLGFADQAYFNRRFKQMYKTNPQRFRKVFSGLNSLEMSLS